MIYLFDAYQLIVKLYVKYNELSELIEINLLDDFIDKSIINDTCLRVDIDYINSFRFEHLDEFKHIVKLTEIRVV